MDAGRETAKWQMWCNMCGGYRDVAKEGLAHVLCDDGWEALQGDIICRDCEVVITSQRYQMGRRPH